MGNTLSVDNKLCNDDLCNNTLFSNSNTLVKCHLCKKDIEQVYDLVKCVRCKICVHYDCEEKYRSNQNYCVCPNCHKIGTLGIKY